MYKDITITNYLDMMTRKIKFFHELKKNGLINKMTIISDGNRKIGKVLNVSTAPIICCGNCKACKKYCYDIKAVIQYADRLKNHVLNARAYNTVLAKYYREEYMHGIRVALAKRRKNKFFRWHVAGDILDYDYFCEMVKIAKDFPDFVMWTYTKMYKIVNRYVAEYGRDAIPNNFHIMFSKWDGAPMDNPYNFPVFACKLKAGNVDTSEDWFAKTYKCPGNCDLCKEKKLGCIGGMNTYADEH